MRVPRGSLRQSLTPATEGHLSAGPGYPKPRSYSIGLHARLFPVKRERELFEVTHSLRQYTITTVVKAPPAPQLM